MTARKYDIEVEQGATFFLSLNYTDSIGAPINLTGYSVQMQVRESAGGRVLAAASTADGRVTVNSSGAILVTVPHTAIAETKQARGVYDLFLQTPDGLTRNKLLYGGVNFVPAVTK